MNCTNDGTFVYCKIGEKLIIGTDTYRVFENGLAPNADFKGIIKIPNFFNDEPIVKIGQYAFTNNLKIEHIIIGENIKEIGRYALGDLPNCKSIYIPASVEILRYHSFSFYNNGNHSIGQGLTQITFAPKSKLKYIENTIVDQKHIQIFTPSILRPVCNGSIMLSTEKKEFFSPFSFKFCNIRSRALLQCTTQRRSNANKVFVIVLIIYSK